MEMSAKIRNADGTLSDAVPLGYIPGVDFEVYGTGPYRWDAFRGPTFVGRGEAKTRIGLEFGLWRAKRQINKHRIGRT